MVCRMFLAAVLLALLAVSFHASLAAAADGNAAAEGKIDFAADIQPLLRERCEKCHGAGDQQSGLRVDAGAWIAQGGDRGPSIVAGKSEESLLYKAIAGNGDEVEAMPLDEPALSVKEIALIKQWIDEGASYPAAETAAESAGKSTHWAFQPMVAHAPPSFQWMSDAPHLAEWPRTAIDCFIAAKLVEEGLTPAPPASRSTLIRRLSLDLRGVLPSVDEVDRFLADDSPDAYERLVDRFLASELYGERWSRPWLDLAHYADSNGFTIDGPREIWKYRDWVINALNRDLPYDRFVTEQIAGDLLRGADGAGPTRDQIVATGFYRNTLVNEEGGTDKEQFRVEAVVDRVNTTGAAFLGLTVGCAQCHEHKYDPLTQREFYQLYAFFNNSEDVNGLPPQLALPTPEQAEAKAKLTSELAAAEQALKDHDAALAAGQLAWEESLAATAPAAWQVVTASEFTSAERASINKIDDGSLIAGGNGNIPAKDVYTIVADVALPKIAAVRLEALTNPNLPKMGPGLADDGAFALSEFAVAGEPLDKSAASQPLSIASAAADWAQPGFPIEQAIDGDLGTAWAIGVTANDGPLNVDREAVFVLAQPIESPSGWRLKFTLSHQHASPKTLLGRFRLSVLGEATSPPAPESIRRLAAIPSADRTAPQKVQLAAAFNRTDKKRQTLEAKLASLKKQETALIAAIPTTLVLKEAAEPRATRIQIRGDFLREGALVTPGTPAAIQPMLVSPPSPEENEQPNRLDLANWLTAPEHPLLARVTVNRYWQHFFGLGLVETENDFGLQGSPPSHPELLDCLALAFQREGWSVKRLHRLIVLSAAYRQSSTMSGAVSPDLVRRDPRNRLLARQSRLRLEAETVRDACLSASGLLTRRVGGPGVYPPQPEGIHILTQVSKAWPEDKDANRYRRGLYTYLWRSNLYPLLPTFDAPDATFSCSRRSRSNTPLQALTVANDPAFVEFAAGLAARLLAEQASDTSGENGDIQRLREAVRICLSREPSAFEQERLLTFLKSQRGQLPDNEQQDLAAWTAVARVLMNLDEFITRE